MTEMSNTWLYAKRCSCGNGYYVDRNIAKEKKGCPACDPELGETLGIRLLNYKMLIGTPVKR